MVSGLTLWGLFEYTDETLFDSIEFTELLDKDTMLTNLIDKWGSVDLYQSNPIIVKRRINTFFLKNYDNFEKMAEALQAEYDPIENYNRHEITNENRDIAKSGEDTSSTTGSNSSSAEGSSSSSGSYTANTGSQTNEHEVSADNETGYNDYNQDKNGARSDTGSSEDGLENSSSASSEFTEGTEEGHSEDIDDDFERTSHIHGNIGVTTSQQMIESEIELRKFNIYDYIADLFAAEFLVRVF